MSHRKQQVESTLKRVISSVLSRQIADPRISGMVTVTNVDVSPDMHHARVMVSVIPEKFQSRTVHGLRSAAGHIHGLVRKAVRMRTVPQLDFRADESLKKQAEVLASATSTTDFASFQRSPSRGVMTLFRDAR